MRGEYSLTLNDKEWDELRHILAHVSIIEREEAIGKALRASERLFINEGKRTLKARLSNDPKNVKMRTGNLMSSFSIYVKKKQGKAHAGFNRKGAHAHLVDRGTVVRETKKRKNRGSISKGMPNKGNYFWQDSFYSKKDDAVNRLYEATKREIEKIIARGR